MPANDTIDDWMNDLIGRRFERVTHHATGKTASWDGDREFSFGEINESANRLARSLLEESGDRVETVALVLEHATPMLVAFLGAVKAGKIATPLDPSWPVPRLAWMIENSGGPVIISNRRNEALARELAGASRRVVLLESLDSAPAADDPDQPFSPDRPTYLLYSSGSTGQPKGIVHSHRTALHNIGIYTGQLQIDETDRLTWLHSPSFSSAWAEILAALLNGATICPWDIRSRGLSGLGEWHNRLGVTVVNWAPSPFRRFMETLSGSTGLVTPRLLVLGSEPVTKRDWELFCTYFPDGCRMVNRLGATEVNNYRMYFLDKTSEPSEAVIPAGYPVPGKELLLVDEAGQPAESGSVGQIMIRSRFCSPGYWRNEELTRKAFQTDPGDPETRLYRTGDLGLLRSDGCLEFHGRADQQVKVRGVRIEIGEIENALTHHAAVREAAVVARPDAEGTLQLVAYVVASDKHLDGRKLRQDLLTTIPPSMMPDLFVFVESLPMTETGKLDRAALPAPSPSQLRSSNGPSGTVGNEAAPATPLEARLAAIWCDVLRMEAIGVHENFFDLGGNSLRALSMFARIEAEFKKSLPLTSLLERPTIGQLAELLADDASSVSGSAIVAIRPGDRKPPLFVLHSITGSILFWQRFLKHLAPDQPVFGLCPPAANGIIQPFEGIEALASRFADQLDASYRNGNFRLAGYSFGGPLAYEIARQLRQRGRSVALLAIIDAYARTEERSWTDRLRLVPAMLVNAWFWLFDDLLPSGPRSIARRFVRFVRQGRGRRSGDHELTSKRNQKMPEYLRIVRQSGKQSMSRYRCQPFDGAITLLRNRLQSWKRLQVSDYGWGKLAPRVNIRIVTFCRHYQMVKEPHVRQVAAALQKELDAVEHD